MFGRVDYVERAIGLCLDHGRALPVDQLRAIGRGAEVAGCRMLEAEVHRGLGIALADPDELRSALAAFEVAGARPLVARVRIELGRLTRDEPMRDSGLEELRRLGDVEHLGRMRAAVGLEA